MAKQKRSSMAEAILETADSLHRVGAMDDETHAKITLRHGRTRPARELTSEGLDREELGTTIVCKER